MRLITYHWFSIDTPGMISVPLYRGTWKWGINERQQTQIEGKDVEFLPCSHSPYRPHEGAMALFEGTARVT